MLIRLILCIELALFVSAQHQMQNYVYSRSPHQDQGNNNVLLPLKNELQSLRREMSSERASCQSQLAEERRQHREHNILVEQLRKAEQQNCQLRIIQAAEFATSEGEMVVIPKEGGRVIEQVKPSRGSGPRRSQRLIDPPVAGHQDSCRRRLDAAEKRHCSLRSILEDDLIDCNERLNASRKSEHRFRQELEQRCSSSSNRYPTPTQVTYDASRTSHDIENLEQRLRDCSTRAEMLWNEGADLRNQLIQVQDEVHRLREELKAKQPNNQVQPFEGAANSTLKVGSTTYFFSTEQVSWWSADESCNSRGWQLVSIETLEEQQELERFIRGIGESRDYWSSATDLGHSHRFTWHARGTPLEPFSRLKDGGPDLLSDVEHCVLAHFFPDTEGHWSDEKCDRKYSYMCETTSS